MRILKFRCWDKTFKRMKVTGFGINEGVLFGEDIEIMQFTGLLDRNGREIYEGDIVRVIDMPCSPDEHEWKGEVVFKHSCWEVVGREELLLYVFEYTNDNGYKPLLYEVIGNIYDNPELLNVPSEKGE